MHGTDGHLGWLCETWHRLGAAPCLGSQQGEMQGCFEQQQISTWAVLVGHKGSYGLESQGIMTHTRYLLTYISTIGVIRIYNFMSCFISGF